MYKVTLTLNLIVASQGMSRLPFQAKNDIDFVIKTALCESFQGPVLRPWAVTDRSEFTVTIEALTDWTESELRTALGNATPILQYAVRDLKVEPLPVIVAGERLVYTVRLCPVINTRPMPGGRCHERDAFLFAKDRGEENPSREAVYTRYLQDRLPGAQIGRGFLERFTLARMMRKDRSAEANAAGVRGRMIPDATLTGVLTVTDPAAFVTAVGAGLGRQRAFGYGLMRVEPVRLALVA